MRWNDRSYPDEFVECRAMGHSYEFDGYYRHRNQIVSVRTCWRCGRELHTFFTKDMERLDTVTRLPDGYTIHRTADEKAKGIRYNRKEANRTLLNEVGFQGDYEE